MSDPAASVLFEAAFERASGVASDFGDMAVPESTLDLLARLTTGLGRRRRVEGRSGATPIRLARDIIEADPAAPLSRASLASRAGLSRFQLHRGFQREFGMPPHRYILQRRAALARRLLKAGHRPVDAALASGFCDQSHPNRVFPQTLLVSPGRYR